MRMRRITVMIVILFGIAQSAWGMMVLPLDLSQMSRQAGKIFVARCHGVETGLDENRIPSTFVRLTVLDGIKGVETGDELLVKQFGDFREIPPVVEGQGAIVPMKGMSLAPGSYRPGSEYLLFLYPESSLGFTSPVGAGQGRFEVSEGGPAGLAGPVGLAGSAGLKIVVNPLGNRFLKTLGNGPVDLETMVNRLKGLVGR